MGADAEEQIMLESNGCEEKILVSIRLRPLNEKEKARNDVSDWECINHNTVIYRNPFQTSERSLYPTAYTFDRVFRGDCSTRQVYEEGAKEVALSVASGINSSLFAYGQTSSGKTYTMCGVTEYTVADIYEYMEKHKEREFLLKFSAMEIYNESVRDLLSADSTPLRLLDDPERGTIVERLKEETLGDWNHFKELLSICEAQRQIGDTSLNETSSRSHQILRLTVESSAREFSGNSNSSILTATVNFVDLAGSERASQALSAGTRLKEGCHINRSLLTLGTVIRKLSKGRTGHIPFRDSKLTRILQSSLGGNARTAIICTISPARSHVEQSRNTLLFASCAKEVTTNAQVNVLMSDKALVKHLQRELSRVEEELRSQGPTSLVSDSAALLREKDLQIEELKKEIKEVTQQREQLILLQEHLTLQQEQLTLQRDLAQSQLKDLLRIVGNERPSVASEEDDNQYPQLRVRRNVWEPEPPVTEMPESTEFQRPYLSVRSFDASQYSDGHSMSNSDDNYLQFSDMDESYQRDASTSPPFGIHTYVETDHMSQEELCKEVRCIEVEEPIESGYMDSNLSCRVPDVPITVVEGIENCDEETQESESPHQELESPSLEDKNLSSPEQYVSIKVVEEIENSDKVNRESESPHQELESPSLEDKTLSSPEQDMSIKVVEGIENCDEVNEESESPSLEDKEESKHINHVSPTKYSNIMFPWVLEKGMYSSRSLKMTRSSSCKEFFLTRYPSYWLEREENYESTPLWGFEKEFTGRPESFQRKSSTLNHRPDTAILTRNESPTSVGTTAVDDLKVQNTETSPCPRCSNNNTPVTVTEELSEFKEKNQLAAAPDDENGLADDDENQLDSADDDGDGDDVEEAEQKCSEEVGLDPNEEDAESNSKWASESGKLQRQIFELWNICNVALVHRTYFFLQLKGHPKESIYMEVELKRLSILKESFSQGNQNAEVADSLKDLRRERQWLSKLMKKKFSELDLQTLYLHWGIGLNTKDRRLQLAHRLWTDTEDMQHITESAKIVSKLVGVARPEPAFKEMFGLYFACPRRSSSWKFY